MEPSIEIVIRVLIMLSVYATWSYQHRYRLPGADSRHEPFTLTANEYISARKLELALASRAKEKQLLVQLRTYFKREPGTGR